MVRRECPECGSNWYSADTKPWICSKCKTVLDERHEKPLNEGREENA